jgi:hypothetical protein
MARHRVTEQESSPAQQQSSQLYFSIDDLAARFRVERSTIERYVHRGKFGDDWFRIGTRIIIPADGVYAFEKSAREKPSA